LAIYHLTAKVISRGRGQSMTAAAAYRSGSSLRDERYGVTHHYPQRRAVAHAEIMAPAAAPSWVYDRQSLWNRVEAGERRKDSQLARAIDIGLPVELTLSEGVALLRDYLAQEFVSKGMIADFCIRRNDADHPYAQVLLTLREATPTGFGPKMRQWNRKSNLLDWRCAWAERANLHLARAGQVARIDHRTLEAQQAELTPGRRTGIGAGRQGAQTLPDHVQQRIAERQRIAKENGDAMLEDPTVALRALCRQQMIFTREDLVRFLQSRTDDVVQREAVLQAVMGSNELIALAPVSGSEPRFTSRDLLEAEKSLMKRVAAMTMRRGRGPSSQPRGAGSASAAMTDELRGVFEYLMGEGDIKALALQAGGDKYMVLGAAREAWGSQGLQVLGAALSKSGTENLQREAAIPSRTLVAQEREWSEGREALTPNHVLVVDGAEMIGLKQLERMLAIADKARAKVVLVGDPAQLRAMGSLSPLQGILHNAGTQNKTA
jgi:Ti-type conjugative transfer relaxase TraA